MLFRSAGAEIFASSCASCHSLSGALGVGPPLDGIAGHKVGGVAGYRYSNSMGSSDLTWQKDSFVKFLMDPASMFPDTAMKGVSVSPEEVGQIYDYLAKVESLQLVKPYVELLPSVWVGFQEKGDVKKLLDEAEVEIFSLAQQHLHRDFVELKEILAESFERLEDFMKKGTHLRGVPTGFTDLDNKLAGMQDSNLLILAARPAGVLVHHRGRARTH